jgi:hypothetical protein
MKRITWLVALPPMLIAVAPTQAAKKPAASGISVALKAGVRASEGETCKIGKTYRIGKSSPIDIKLLKVEIKQKLAIKTLFGASETLDSGDMYRYVVVHFVAWNPNAKPVAFFALPDHPGQRPVLHMGVNATADSGDSFVEMEPRTFRYGSNHEFGATSQNRKANDISPKKSDSRLDDVSRATSDESHTTSSQLQPRLERCSAVLA